MTVRLPIWHTAQESGSLVSITYNYELAVHSYPLLACRGRLRNSGANCSTVAFVA